MGKTANSKKDNNHETVENFVEEQNQDNFDFDINLAIKESEKEEKAGTLKTFSSLKELLEDIDNDDDDDYYN